jgi:multidrug efflux pump subunit AcrA (membrane-fusion protein)
MLQLHQKVGIGLAALTLATVVVGQLNYSDKYGSNAPVTGQYEATHTVLSFTTLGVFAVDGKTARFVPVETGMIGGLEIEVKQGLAVGRPIVAGPWQSLKDLRDGAAIRTAGD